MSDADAAALAPVLTQLAAARTRLIMERPFLGALVMHLPLKPAPDWCKTTATDARAFYFNPSFISQLNLAQTQFVLAHEAMHCAMGHDHRRNGRIKRRWNVACEHAVNLVLIEDGMKPPLHGILADQNYLTLSAEEIYPLIPDDTKEDAFDEHLFGDESQTGSGGEPGVSPRDPESGDAGRAGQSGESEPQACDGEVNGTSERPDPLTPNAREELAEQWKTRLASAAQAARQAGKLSQSMLRWVDDLLAPSLPWRALIARFFAVNQRDDYSWRRPSRREGDAILPRLSSEGLEVVAALDTSGSISDVGLREFVAEIDALKGQVRARVTLLACDHRIDVNAPWEYEPWDTLQFPSELDGGGGTDFRPVFDWVEAEHRSPDLMIYFTDAEGNFPQVPPSYPVIWLVKGKGRVPWGERVQLN